MWGGFCTEVVGARPGQAEVSPGQRLELSVSDVETPLFKSDIDSPPLIADVAGRFLHM